MRQVLVEIGGHGRLVAHEPEETIHLGPPLLHGDAEVAHTASSGVGIAGGEEARVEAGIHGDGHSVAAVDDLPAGHGPLLGQRHTGFVHEPHRLVGTDDVRAGAQSHDVGAQNVVEVAVAHEDEIGLVDLGRRQADLGCRRHPIEERIEPDRQPVDA